METVALLTWLQTIMVGVNTVVLLLLTSTGIKVVMMSERGKGHEE